MSKPISVLSEICSVPGTDVPLRFEPDGSATSADGRRFRAVRGVPILRDEPPALEIRPPDLATNPVNPDQIEQLRSVDGYTLFVGAGSSSFRSERVIEFEYQLFRDTDVVGDAHALPFRSNTFDAFVAMNVFEHLEDPPVAAREALRVLRPGGEITIHTAFLQPVHEAPAHYFNATEWGVRRWFAPFSDVHVEVTPNFNPLYSVTWIAHDLLAIAEEHVDKEARDALAALRLEDLAAFWRDPSSLDQKILDHFWSLPREAQTSIAAGFQMTARKPM